MAPLAKKNDVVSLEALLSHKNRMPALPLTGDMRVRAPQGFFCSRPWTGFEVEDGEVRMCCWARHSWGNIAEATINDIWNGEAAQNTRRAMTRGEYDSICTADCPYIAGIFEDSPPTHTHTEAFKTNLELNLKEIEAGAEVLKSKPRYFKLLHSTLCNIDCVMCYQDRKNSYSIPESFYRELTGYYGAAQEILLMGGEPLAIRRIRQFAEEFPQRDHPDVGFEFITNGTIYDEKAVQLIESLQVRHMVISLDAATETTYEHIRRKAVWRSTLRGVEVFASLAKKRNFSLTLAFTVMRDNQHEVSAFVRLAHGFNLDCQFSLVNGVKGDQFIVDIDQLRMHLANGLECANLLAEDSSGVLTTARGTLSNLLDMTRDYRLLHK